MRTLLHARKVQAVFVVTRAVGVIVMMNAFQGLRQRNGRNFHHDGLALALTTPTTRPTTKVFLRQGQFKEPNVGQGYRGRIRGKEERRGIFPTHDARNAKFVIPPRQARRGGSQRSTPAATRTCRASPVLQVNVASRRVRGGKGDQTGNGRMKFGCPDVTHGRGQFHGCCCCWRRRGRSSRSGIEARHVQIAFGHKHERMVDHVGLHEKGPGWVVEIGILW